MKFFAAIRSWRHAPWLLVLLGAAVAVAAYLQALHYPFVSDDITYVVTNKALAELPADELWRLFLKPYTIGFEFLPIRDLSYWIDISLFGQNPAGYRLHSILLYLLTLPLMYAVTARLWRYFRPAEADSAPWIAAVVTALFAVHPALIESVVWISGRKYVLPGLFSMLALWLALGVRCASGFSSRHAVLTLVAFIAVMFSKSSYVGVAPLIAVLWLVFWLDLDPSRRKWSLLLWPLSIMVLAVFLLVVFIVDNLGLDRIPPYFGLESVARSLGILGGLIRISIGPEARHFFYPVFEDRFFPFMVALGVAAMIAAVWGMVALLRKRSLGGFAVLAFLLLCLPYLQLVPAKPPSMVADRYVELAIWPAMFLIVSLAWRTEAMIRIALLICLALSFTFQTIERTRDWISLENLENIDTKAYPGFFAPALYTLRNTYLHDGRYREALELAETVRPPEIGEVMGRLVRLDYFLRHEAVNAGNPRAAVEQLLEFQRAIAIAPEQVRWNSSMYFIWMKLGETLADEWEFAADKFPDNIYVRYNAGLYFMHLEFYWQAEANLRKAIELNQLPENLKSVAYWKLGTAYAKTGRLREAESVLNAALKLPRPDSQVYCVLAEVYGKSGRLQEEAEAKSKCGRASQ